MLAPPPRLLGVDDERPILRQAYERRVAAMQALLAFDVSAIPLEADLDPSRAPTS